MQQGLDEAHYDHVRDAHAYDAARDAHAADEGYTPRELLAIELAERFALDHRAIDEELFGRLRMHFSDTEILELVTTCGFCVGIGRVLQVLDVERDFDVLWSREPGGGPRRPPD